MERANPLRVLAVDDEPLSLTLLAESLAAGGHQVLTAHGGADALKIALAEGPPVIVIDWLMPDMDGLSLCRAVRSQEGIGFAYIIILTENADEARVVEALDAGADDCIAKPFKQGELLARIRAGQRIIQLHHDLDRQNRHVHMVNAQAEIANDRLTKANEQLHRMATFDELTGLFNRREALIRLGERWSSSERYGVPLACIVADIDHFKSYNDRYGHAIGDVVLRETAFALSSSARHEEGVCRVGGEEFLVICSGADEATAAVGAERLRRAVEARTIRCEDLELSVTITLGVAQRTPTMAAPDELLKAADSAMYLAKAAGRNCVCLASKATPIE